MAVLEQLRATVTGMPDFWNPTEIITHFEFSRPTVVNTIKGGDNFYSYNNYSNNFNSHELCPELHSMSAESHDRQPGDEPPGIRSPLQSVLLRDLAL